MKRWLSGILAMAVMIVSFVNGGVPLQAGAEDNEILYACDLKTETALDNWTGSDWEKVTIDDQTFMTSKVNNSFTFYNLGAEWTNYTIRTLVRFNWLDKQNNVCPAVAFRCQDAGNSYVVQYTPLTNEMILYKRVNNAFNIIHSKQNVMLTENTTYVWEISVVEDSIYLAVDGNPVFTFRDGSYKTGGIGFRVHYGNPKPEMQNEVYYGDVQVKKAINPMAKLPFTDEFDAFDGRLWVSAEGDFRAENGYLCSSKNSIAYIGDTAWQNYAVTARFVIDPKTGNSSPGLLFRVQDGQNFYMLTSDYNNQKLILHKRTNGNFEVIKEVAFKPEVNVPFTLKAYVYGEEITCYANSLPLIQVHDSTFSAGMIGLRRAANADGVVRIDSISAIAVHNSLGSIPIIKSNCLFFDNFRDTSTEFWTDEASCIYSQNGIELEANEAEGYMLGGEETLTGYRAEV